jgi:hypothetical protein
VLSVVAAALVTISLPRSARADDAPAPAEPPLDAARLRALSGSPGGLWHLTAGTALGAGLRFNNPYRLERQLGDDSESLSLTSGYLDLGLAAAYGAADGLAHGAALRLSIALSGVAQQALAPTYFVAYRTPSRAMAFARLGPSVLLAPDVNVGGEAGLGAAYLLTGAVGASAELVFDLFYGAATPDVAYSVYPIVAGQLGLFVDYEVLP